MNKAFNKIIKLLLTFSLIFSIFNFTACDNLEDVSLDAGLSSISVTKPPLKTRYLTSDFNLDVTGIEVTATYRSGYSKLIPISELKFSGFKETSGNDTSQETIFVTYTDGMGVTRTCTFSITYADVKEIYITRQPDKMIYTQKTPLALWGIVITAGYYDGSSQPVFSDGIYQLLCEPMFGPNHDESILTDADQNRILTYNGRDANGSKVPLIIPLSYRMDENLNFVTNIYNERILTSYLEFKGFDASNPSNNSVQQEVTVDYVEQPETYLSTRRVQTKFNVTYSTLESIQIEGYPIKGSYLSGGAEALDFTGLKLKAVYKNGASEIVFSDSIYENLTTISPERRKEIAAYTGLDASNNPVDLKIPLEWQYDTYGNPVKDSQGVRIPARQIVFSGFNDSRKPTTEIDVAYQDWLILEADGKPTEKQVKIQYTTSNLQSSLMVAQRPTKQKYYRGDTLDLSGLVLQANYQNGTTEIIFSDQILKNLTTITESEKFGINVYDGLNGYGDIIPLEIPLQRQPGDTEHKLDPVRKITFEGFDSSRIVSSQEIVATYIIDNGGSKQTAQTSFAIRYVDLANIQIVTTPVKTKYKQYESLDLKGLIVNAIYQDNAADAIFTDEIFDDFYKKLSTDEQKKIDGYTGLNDEPLVLNLTNKTSLEIQGFNSNVNVPQQEIKVIYTDSSQGSSYKITRQSSFNITYKNLSGIRMTSIPDQSSLGGEKNAVISFDGVIIESSYTDNSSEVVFSKEIFDALPAEYKTGADTYKGGAPLEIILQKSGDTVVRKIKFAGYDSTAGVQNQTVTVTYTEGAPVPRTGQVQYNVRYDGLHGISVNILRFSKFIMDSDSTTEVIGGIGRKVVNRNGADQPLDDIKNWHFYASSMQIIISYNNGTTKTVNFTNPIDPNDPDYKKCYGSGTKGTEAYVVDSKGNLQYMQRWGKDAEGNEYKFKINGFDPIAVFKTTGSNESVPQTLKISYTEGDTTVCTSTQITYSFRRTYQFTERFTNNCLGDFPQSKKSDSVAINKLKTDKGMFVYQLGSDGNLYTQKDGTYYKWEPIKWVKLSDEGYYRTEKVIYSGIPYYAGKYGRTNSVSKDFQWVNDGHGSTGSVSFTNAIDNGSFTYSTIRNWLNGNNQNGDSTYDGRGFLQTAFTPTAISESTQDFSAVEYYKTKLSVTGSAANDSTVAYETRIDSAGDFHYYEHSQFRVMIPGDFKSSPGYTAKLFNFDPKCSDGPYGRIHRNPIKEVWDYLNYADNYQLSIDKVPSTTDFAGSIAGIWLASDARMSDMYITAGVLNNNNIRVYQYTSNNQQGIVPIIHLNQ